MSSAYLAALCGAVAAVTAASSWALARWHARIPLMDVPNARSSHDRPKPRSGGIAIFLGVTLGWGLAGHAGNLGVPTLVLGAAGGFFLLGLFDDLKGSSEWARLFIQSALAVAVSVWGPALRTLDIPGMAPLHLPRILSICFTAFWYVGFINVFNFMDGTDGIAAGEAVIAGITMAILGGGPLPLLVAAAALGFLVLNYEPSSIFMGDSGSYMLGFLLAESAVLGGGPSGRVIPFGSYVLILGTVIIDTTATLLRRIYRREQWFKAHRSHYYQRLTDLGWSHARVFWTNLALTGALSVSALRYADGGRTTQLLLSVGWLAAMAMGILWIGARERHIRSSH